MTIGGTNYIGMFLLGTANTRCRTHGARLTIVSVQLKPNDGTVRNGAQLNGNVVKNPDHSSSPSSCRRAAAHLVGGMSLSAR